MKNQLLPFILLVLVIIGCKKESLDDTVSNPSLHLLQGLPGINQHSLTQTKSGDYLVAGFQNHAFRLTKLSADGKICWEKNYETDDYACQTAVAELDNGEIVLFGGTSEVGVGETNSVPLMIHLKANGKEIGRTSFPDWHQMNTVQMVKAKDNTIIVAFYNYFSGNTHGGHLARINTDGQIQWQVATGDLLAQLLTLVDDNTILLAGQTVDEPQTYTQRHTYQLDGQLAASLTLQIPTDFGLSACIWDGQNLLLSGNQSFDSIYHFHWLENPMSMGTVTDHEIGSLGWPHSISHILSGADGRHYAIGNQVGVGLSIHSLSDNFQVNDEALIQSSVDNFATVIAAQTDEDGRIILLVKGHESLYFTRLNADLAYLD